MRSGYFRKMLAKEFGLDRIRQRNTPSGTTTGRLGTSDHIGDGTAGHLPIDTAISLQRIHDRLKQFILDLLRLG